MNTAIVKNEVVINWKDVFLTVLKRWWLILLCLIIGGGGGFALGVMADRPVYESKAVYVLTYNSGNNSINSMASEYSFLNRILNNCVEIARQNTFVNLVVDELNEGVDPADRRYLDPDDVAQCIEYSYSTSGTLIYITVDTPSADLSYRIVQSITHHFHDHVISTYDLTGGDAINFSLINTPELAEEPLPSSERVMFTAVGGVALAVLCIVILAVIALVDNRIKHEEDVKNKYNAPILGLIPDFYDSNLNKGVYQGYGTK